MTNPVSVAQVYEWLGEVPDPDPYVSPPPAPDGLDYRDEANIPVWWSMGMEDIGRVTASGGELLHEPQENVVVVDW